MRKFAATVSTCLMLGSSLLMAGTALAQELSSTDLGTQYGALTGLGTKDIRVTVAQIIRVAMGLLGIVAVVIILIGGFTWMTAGGNDEKVGQAKKWIFAGIIGLIIIFSAYALSTYILNSLITATTGPAPTTP